MSGAAAAQVARDSVPADTVYRIAPIRVQMARPVTTAGGASAVEVNLDSLGLAPVSTAADVLRELPLVQVRTNSRGEVQFALRGAGTDTRQAAVLVDGVPLTLGWDARTDLSIIPTTAARSLTLTRGAPSVLYGPNALGGVVLIGVGSALDARTRPELSAGASVLSTGEYVLSVTGTRPLDLDGGTLALRTGAGFRDRPGLARPDGFTAAADDLLLNTDSRQVDGFFGGRYSGDGGEWLSLSASGFSAERGVAPEAHVPDPRLWRYPELRRGVAALSGGTGERTLLAGQQGDVEASVGIDVGRSLINSYATAGYDDVAGTELGEDRTLTLRLLADHTLGSRAELSGAVTYADITHDETIDDGESVRYRQRLWSGALEGSWRPALSATSAIRDLRLTLGGALDGADTPETGGRPQLERLSGWGARLGATAAMADGALLLHGAASRRARFPALRELYSGALGRFEPNPQLDPELLEVIEAGATARLGNAEIQAVGFAQRLSDAVVRITTEEGLFRRVNRNELRTTGIELMASTLLGPLTLVADATLQDVVLDDPDAGAQTEPEYQPSIVAGFTARAPLPAQFEAMLQTRYTGVQYCVDPETGGDRELDAWTRVDAELGRDFSLRQAGVFSRASVRIALDNTFDSVLYDQCGIPQPGRTLRAQVRLW